MTDDHPDELTAQLAKTSWTKEEADRFNEHFLGLPNDSQGVTVVQMNHALLKMHSVRPHICRSVLRGIIMDIVKDLPGQFVSAVLADFVDHDKMPKPGTNAFKIVAAWDAGMRTARAIASEADVYVTSIYVALDRYRPEWRDERKD